MRRIILFGSQGSGKGTQADLLSLKLKIPRIEVGNLWRKEIADGTPWGKEYAELYRAGKLAPDDQTVELLRRRITAQDAQEGFILDGYPRNRAQLDTLEVFGSPTQVFLLKLSDEESIKRLIGRLFCKTCGRSYHVVYNPPREQLGEIWYCDYDTTALTTRDDDKPEAIKERLEIYHAQTEPLLDIYRQRGIVYEIDATKPIEEVHATIMKSLEAA